MVTLQPHCPDGPTFVMSAVLVCLGTPGVCPGGGVHCVPSVDGPGAGVGWRLRMHCESRGQFFSGVSWCHVLLWGPWGLRPGEFQWCMHRLRSFKIIISFALHTGSEALLLHAMRTQGILRSTETVPSSIMRAVYVSTCVCAL